MSAALEDHSASKYVRAVIAGALGDLGDTRAVGPVIDALKVSDAEVRGAADDALKRLR